MAIPVGRAVRHRLTDRRGVMAETPYRQPAPPGMRWVWFDDDARPKLAVERMIEPIRRLPDTPSWHARGRQ